MIDIATQELLRLHKIVEQASPANDTLLSGRLGLVLYYYSFYEAFDDPKYAEKAVEIIEQVFSNLNKSNLQLFGNAFGSGGAGLGYVVTRLSKAGLVEVDLQNDISSLDEYLYTAALDQILHQDKIDYLHGATGTIHYFTQRMPDKKAEEYLNKLITALCNKAVIEKNGTWFRNWVMEKKETADINFSISHGLSGFLLLLINAYNAGINLPCIKETVEKGIEFILSFQQDIDMAKNKWSFFPSIIKANNHTDFFISQRMAWCYGDFGPVLVLYKAAQIIDRPDWIEKANLFGTFTIMRKTPEATANTQTFFCHGSAGIAQVYDSLFHLSGIDRYKEAQQYWIDQTLSMLPGELEKAIYHGKECELLEGLAGINLCLLSFIFPNKTSWSNAFLL